MPVLFRWITGLNELTAFLKESSAFPIMAELLGSLY
jgi:hypothetical protein